MSKSWYNGLTPTAKFDNKKLEDHVSSTIDSFVAQYNIPWITVQETQKMIHKLSSSKATGPDAISVKLLKMVSPVFSHPLTRLFNLSIVKGTLPSKWKVTRITPLYKDGAHDSRDNDRPISLLSVLSKVMEKHVATSFVTYLVAFAKVTLLSLLWSNLQTKYRSAWTGTKLLGMIFVDFGRAFYVVDHQPLVSKLRLYRASDSHFLGLHHIFPRENSSWLKMDKDQTRLL